MEVAALRAYLNSTISGTETLKAVDSYLNTSLKNNVSPETIGAALQLVSDGNISASQISSLLNNMDMSALQSVLQNSFVEQNTMNATDASMKNALDMKLPKLTVGVMDQILYENEVSLPMFNEVFSMAWSVNKQWVPSSFTEDDIGNVGEGGAGSVQGALNSVVNGVSSAVNQFVSEWMVPKSETPEYFDYLQLFFNGAIDNMTTDSSKILNGIVDPFKQAYDQVEDDAKQAKKVLSNVKDQISQFQSESQDSGSQSRNGMTGVNTSQIQDAAKDIFKETKDFALKQF